MVIQPCAGTKERQLRLSARKAHFPLDGDQDTVDIFMGVRHRSITYNKIRIQILISMSMDRKWPLYLG